jgi:hypothetical protein
MKWSGTTPTLTRLLLPILLLGKWRFSNPSANMPWVRAVGCHSDVWLNNLFCIYLHTRGQVLRRNPDKILQSFPPCYSQSPLQICLEISISSKSSNLLQFLHCITGHCNGERRKTWQKTTPPSLWFRKSVLKWFRISVQKPQVWELSRLRPETSKKLSVTSASV